MYQTDRSVMESVHETGLEREDGTDFMLSSLMSGLLTINIYLVTTGLKRIALSFKCGVFGKLGQTRNFGITDSPRCSRSLTLSQTVLPIRPIFPHQSKFPTCSHGSKSLSAAPKVARTLS